MPASRAQISSARPPQTRSLKVLRQAALGCRACPLYRRATQTVFGAGATHAAVVLVGEQPGDKEDLEGSPFVGPAGKMLDRALADAGIERSEVYLTNAVKHFKWEKRGKRRIHAKPSAGEILACGPWLEAELRLLKPRFLVCLGATAARAVCGRPMKISTTRGAFISTPWSDLTLVTMHPSALLRATDEAARKQAYDGLVADLSLIRRHDRKQ